jgi:hypothetical protein
MVSPVAWAIVSGFLVALAACGNAPSSSPLPAAATEEPCVSEGVSIQIEHGQIFWNGEVIDEPEVARRSAAHWCGERPYAIRTDQALPAPDDHASIALSIRVGQLIGTKQAKLANTLKRRVDGSY